MSNNNPNPISLDDVVVFIREKGLLKAWSDRQIKATLFHAILKSAITFDTDKNGKLTDICFGRWESPEHFHVMCIYGDLKKLIKYVTEVFPQCERITGQRGKHLKVFQTKKLLNRINKV